MRMLPKYKSTFYVLLLYRCHNSVLSSCPRFGSEGDYWTPTCASGANPLG
jgi:hypothetical protein